ncbi:MAG: PilZ domain-containing protein [Candidatus Omnitrophica bacterium]|nr:PilZ domain-containing protein [Candidatus Omnitrophota bacterium]
MRTPRPIRERRASVRVVDSLSFKIGHEDYQTEARTLNISSHGAMCLVPSDIPMMTQLKVAFVLPFSKEAGTRTRQIKAKGVVVRKEKDVDSDRALIAIYFTQIRETDQKALDRYIRNRLDRGR